MVWVRVAIASAVMGAACFYAASQLNWAAAQASPWLRISTLCGILAMAVVLYFGSLSLLRLSWRRLLKAPPETPAHPVKEPPP